jgi:hypothetical protein
MQGSLHCLTIFVDLAPHVIKGPEQVVVVQRGQVWTVGKMVKHFPAKLLNFLECQVCSVKACTIMLSIFILSCVLATKDASLDR